MLLSRSRPERSKKIDIEQKVSKDVKKLDDFLNKRDYIGPITIMEYERKNAEFETNDYLWLAYCYFHAGDYKNACEIYELLIKQSDCPPQTYLWLACSYFFMAMYEEARDVAEKAENNSLQNRLLFHVSHKLHDEKKLMLHHSKLETTVEDQLCLASIHYLRSHYQESIDIYKTILSKNLNFIALNVYLALCYYKLDYYDVSMEVLQSYIDKYPDSLIAVNLKACNQYRLYNSKAAENTLKSLKSSMSNELSFAKDIIAHNTVVFRNGDAALQVLPALVDVIPEAKLNLVIHYLKKNDFDSAFALIDKFDAQLTQEFLLKAITFCIKGNEINSNEYLNIAADCFKVVGESSAECDTIIGRQCMASAFFLLKEFEEVLVYLDSIKTFFTKDEIFCFNYGQTLVMCDKFEEGEKHLLQVMNSNDIIIKKLTTSLAFYQCLCKAYILNGKSKLAWNLFLKSQHMTSDSTIKLLHLIANECYKLEEYVIAVKAFEELEKRYKSDFDNSVIDKVEIVQTIILAKQCACAGVVKMFVENRCTIEDFRQVVFMLENDHDLNSQQILAKIQQWANENKVF